MGRRDPVYGGLGTDGPPVAFVVQSDERRRDRGRLASQGLFRPGDGGKCTGEVGGEEGGDVGEARWVTPLQEGFAWLGVGRDDGQFKSRIERARNVQKV